MKDKMIFACAFSIGLALIAIALVYCLNYPIKIEFVGLKELFGVFVGSLLVSFIIFAIPCVVSAVLSIALNVEASSKIELLGIIFIASFVGFMVLGGLNIISNPIIIFG